MTIVERIVAFCCRWPWAVITVCLVLAGGTAWYTTQNFAMNTDSEQLIDAKVGWRMRQARFDAAFPQQTNQTVVVIDGATPELAESATARLTEKLVADKHLFNHVQAPGGGPFFNQNGMLFLSLKEVQNTTQQLIKAQPFLGGLAADPSLRGIMTNLDTVLLGVGAGQAKLADIDGAMARFADVFDAAAHGRTEFLSWRSLITGAKPRPEEIRRFIEVKPRLDFNALEPGLEANDRIRAEARALGITPEHGVGLRLTGPVPLSDEEFATLTDRAGLMIGAMMGGVLLTLWLALRSFRIIFAILVTLFVGLAITMGLGLKAVGVFNIISIAFIALFVGLGVDFGIQFSVRYRSERHRDENLMRALAATGRGVGVPLALAAAATAAGFFSFLPTTYTGVAELGKVAGIGMIVAFLLSITMLPAMLMLLNPPGEDEDVGFKSLGRLDDFMTRHRRNVLRIAAGAGVVSMGLMAFVQFDSNPLDLRSPKVESVSTLFDLMKNPLTSPNTIDVPALSLNDAESVAARIRQEPLVGETLTLFSFVPEQQTEKLALIADANNLLDATLNPFEVLPAPSDAERIAAFKATAGKLRAAAGNGQDKPARDARRLADALDAVVGAGKPAIDRAHEAIVPSLKTMLKQVSDSLKAAPVTVQTIPADFRAGWVAADGTARIQVFPKNNSNDPAALSAFSDQVLSVAPQATGAPISIRESGKTIVGAFAEAGVLSFIVIILLLVLVLRSVHDVLMTLAPLVLSGLLTLATCVVLGLRLNFANVIALPLLLGIGVAFNIYFVVAWRHGQRCFLASSLTRAVIFSAATTASGFGTLWLSVHPGTASMGELLMISLGWVLATTLFLSPALLGAPTHSLQFNDPEV
ncbi:MAG: MMPL family transporter [Alphaproteobacteria bacterium]|nr:MMPL family transporter [Alphaproteobacteria bacterium]